MITSSASALNLPVHTSFFTTASFAEVILRLLGDMINMIAFGTSTTKVEAIYGSVLHLYLVEHVRIAALS